MPKRPVSGVPQCRPRLCYIGGNVHKMDVDTCHWAYCAQGMQTHAFPGLHVTLSAQVANLANEEIPQIYALCGQGPRSSLRVLRPGLAISEMAVSPLPGAPTGVWTVPPHPSTAFGFSGAGRGGRRSGATGQVHGELASIMGCEEWNGIKRRPSSPSPAEMQLPEETNNAGCSAGCLHFGAGCVVASRMRLEAGHDLLLCICCLACPDQQVSSDMYGLDGESRVAGA